MKERLLQSLKTKGEFMSNPPITVRHQKMA